MRLILRQTEVSLQLPPPLLLLPGNAGCFSDNPGAENPSSLLGKPQICFIALPLSLGFFASFCKSFSDERRSRRDVDRPGNRLRADAGGAGPHVPHPPPRRLPLQALLTPPSPFRASIFWCAARCGGEEAENNRSPCRDPSHKIRLSSSPRRAPGFSVGEAF